MRARLFDYTHFWRRYTAILVILALALVWRLPQLNGSFWLDEAAQALESARPLSQQLQIVDDFQPPLLHLMVFAAERVSTQEWWLRSISALIPGLLSILGVYLIGQELSPSTRTFSKMGALAALLLATSSFHTFYSQELRQYSLPTAWAVWSWWILIRHQSEKSWTKTEMGGFWVMTVLGLYTSYLYPFVLIGQAIYLLWHQRVGWKISIWLGVPALGFLPWLPMFFQQLKAGQTLRVDLPGWENVVSFPVAKAVLLTMAKFLYGPMDTSVTPFFILPVVILALGSLWLIIDAFRRTKPQVYRPLLCWLVFSFLAALAVSMIIPVVQPKRVLWLLPAAYLAISFLATSSKHQLARWVGALCIGMLLSLNIISSVTYWTNPDLQREDWRRAVADIHQRFEPHNTVVVFGFSAPFAGWEWYDHRAFPTATPKKLFVATAADAQALGKLPPASSVLVFDYLRDLSDPSDVILEYVTNQGYREVDHLQYPVIGKVRIYQTQRNYAYRP